MQVQVRLLLQGGHVWQFRCADDDPLIFGLVSALPGAAVAENLPADGLIQVETGSGDRLFLTRSSLVSLEIRDLSDRNLPELAGRNAAAHLPLPAQASMPAPFVLMPQALPSDLVAALLEDAFGQFQTLDQGSHPRGARLLDIGRVPAVRKVVEAILPAMRGALGVPELLETQLHLELRALEARASLPFDDRSEDVLSFVFGCRRSPAVTGGIRLFDSRTEQGVQRAGAGFRDIEVADNTLLLFPGTTVCAGLPVQSASGAQPEHLFVVSGALRRMGSDG